MDDDEKELMQKFSDKDDAMNKKIIEAKKKKDWESKFEKNRG